MQPILFDDHSWENLLPLSFTRPVADLRVGILTIAEKWEKHLDSSPSHLTQEHLSGKFPLQRASENLLINGSLLPGNNILQALMALGNGEALKKGDTLLGACANSSEAAGFEQQRWLDAAKEYHGDVSLIDYPWKIFSLNGQEIEADIALLTRGRKSEKLSNTVRAIAPENIFVEPGFKGEHITLNASSGPFYLGVDSEIMEGSVIRGPFALCEGSTVKLSAKIYGPTTIGPHCKAGGEIRHRRPYQKSRGERAYASLCGNE